MSDSLIQDYDQFAAILAKYYYQPKTNDILAGRVIAIERKQALVSLGLNYVGFLPKQEIVMDTLLPLSQYFRTNYIGEFLLLEIEENKIILSLERLHHNRLWERLRQIKLSYMILYANTEKSTSGGKILRFDGIKFFAPNSHIPKYFRREQNTYPMMPLKLLKITRKAEKIKITGSSRFAFVKRQSSFLKVGTTHKACIDSMKPFGIFLTIFGVKCLLHISEISDKRITNLKAMYKKGNTLKVLIIYINRNKGQIALSAKRA